MAPELSHPISRSTFNAMGREENLPSQPDTSSENPTQAETSSENPRQAWIGQAPTPQRNEMGDPDGVEQQTQMQAGARATGNALAAKQLQ
jgi:hypothetical protein